MTTAPETDATTVYAQLAPQATDGTISEGDAERFVATLQSSWGPEQSMPWATHLLTAHPEWHGVRMAMGQIMQASGDASGAAQVAYAYEQRPSLVMGAGIGEQPTSTPPLAADPLVSSEASPLVTPGLVNGGMGSGRMGGVGNVVMGLLMSTGRLHRAGDRRHRYGPTHDGFHDPNDPYDRRDNNGLSFNLSSFIPQKYRLAVVLVSLVVIGGMYFMLHGKTDAASQATPNSTPAMTQSQQPSASTTPVPVAPDQPSS